MKILYFSIAYILLTTKAYSQGYRDTLYVNKNTNDIAQQIIFLDSPHSSFHKLVFDNLLSDSTLFGKGNSPFSQSATNRNGRPHPDYFGDWITVQKYKGKPVAYYPSEPYFNIFMRISDSTVIVNDFNEGFITLIIFKKKIRKSKYTFELLGDFDSRHSLSIKYRNGTSYEVTSSLFNVKTLNFVKRKSYFDLPIIVNYCPGNRCEEFKFK